MENSNVFITGVTGYIGGELLIELSQNPTIHKIYCLVRGRRNADPYDRLQGVFDFRRDQFDRTKVVPIVGDLQNDELEAQLINNELLKEVDTVIHCAANTSFSPYNTKNIEKVNIGGLTQVMNWAKQLENLRVFTYVGTAHISGRNYEKKYFQEDDTPDPTVEHCVKYTRTKMQGEMLLRRVLPEDKLLIVRPSIIAGDNSNPIPRSVDILWAISLLNTLRLCPIDPEVTLDSTPIEFAVEAITKLVFKKDRKYNTYHISSGRKYCTDYGRVSSVLAEGDFDFPPYKFVPRESFQQIKNWSKGKAVDPVFMAENKLYFEHFENLFEDKSELRSILSVLEPYLNFLHLGHIFENDRVMNEIDVTPPQPAHEYIHELKYFLNNIDLFEGTFVM